MAGEGDARSSAELAVKHVSWSKVVCAVAAGGDGGRRPPDLPAQSVDAVSASDCRTTPLNRVSKKTGNAGTVRGNLP
jgi:hypothetical protein